MLTTEVDLYDKLRKLKILSDHCKIKAEYEAEGSSFRELVRLCRVVSDLNIGIHLKIGGVEALTDARDAFELDVNGIIAPMVESKFGLKKFINTIEQVYQNQYIEKCINIETKSGVNSLEEILDYAAGKIHQVTIGRTDLSASYFDDNITPDCPFIFDVIFKVANACKKRGLSVAIGGSISSRTIQLLKYNVVLSKAIDFIETRKVIFPTEVWLNHDNVIETVLDFEKTYIESVDAFHQRLTLSEQTRLDELNRRVLPLNRVQIKPTRFIN